MGRTIKEVPAASEIGAFQVWIYERNPILKAFTRRKTGRADAATQIFPRTDVSDSFLPCLCIKFWTPVLLMTMMALIAESILAGVAYPELVYIDIRRLSWKLASNLDSLSFARKTRRRFSHSLLR